jgi:molybdate transport system ATP-binding protein
MALLNLGGLEDRLPGQLSGGQQQRVALARALARPVDVLLLDEPFSALDETLRADLRSELLRLRAELAVPIVFVTHDLREAHLLADRIAVLDGGRVLQFAPRDDVFRRPQSPRVAELTGVRNIFPAIVAEEEEGGYRLDAQGLSLLCEAGAAHFRPGNTVDVAIRAERVIVHRREPEALPGVPNLLVVEVVDELAYGSGHIVRCRPIDNGPMLEVELSARPYEVLGLGQRGRWTLELPPADLHVMPKGSP